eukprot:7177107-Ditylum_brightwellii.AAC.1
MYTVDCWDMVHAAKHGRMVDMLHSDGFAVYCSIHSTIKAVRRRGQSKFMLDAFATGLPLMLTELKKKKHVAVDDETLLAYSEGIQNLTSIQ